MLETQISVVHCARCQFTSPDLDLFRCPSCGKILGETVVTRRPGSQLAVALHWLVVLLAVAMLAASLAGQA